MNRKMVFYTLGRIMLVIAALLLLPTACAVYFKETTIPAFAITVTVSIGIGLALTFACRTKNRVIFAKEGFAIVALTWVAASAVGALPFFISHEIPSYIDAFFETVSGFTTTGASILENVEVMSKSLLFWRSFTHWIGGMGVIVFVMMFTNLSDRSLHIMRAEMPGPIVGKLMPRAKDTARLLYIIYIVLTVALIILLRLGGMPLFESVLHAFGTAGTGGFGIKSDSIAGYSPYIQWVITVFMLLFGVNFNLYYLILIKRFRTAVRSTEMWTYFGIVGASTAIITANIFSMSGSFSRSLRDAAFQVSSIITTTGYSTVDFDRWPSLSKTVLVILMFIGACAGSTGGGFKVSRVIILFKMIKRELVKLLHPRSVRVIRFEGKPLDEATVSNTGSYLAVYSVCFFAILLTISVDGFDLETNFTAVASCFNNIGPGLSKVGPVMNFSCYSPFSTAVLSAAMLLGRLEIFPILLAAAPSTWSKRK